MDKFILRLMTIWYKDYRAKGWMDQKMYTHMGLCVEVQADWLKNVRIKGWKYKWLDGWMSINPCNNLSKYKSSFPFPFLGPGQTWSPQQGCQPPARDSGNDFGRFSVSFSYIQVACNYPTRNANFKSRISDIWLK